MYVFEKPTVRCGTVRCGEVLVLDKSYGGLRWGENTTLEFFPYLYTRAHGESYAISSTFSNATFAVKMAQTAGTITGAYIAAVQRI